MRLTPRALWSRISRASRSLTNSRAVDHELHDELTHYVEQLAAAKIASGMDPRAAHREAVLETGNLTNIREGVRASFWESAVSSAFADLRFAFRTLRRNRIFAIVVVGVIAIGIGAMTTIFSGVNAYLFKPLPGTTQGAQLIQIDRTKPGTTEGTQASFAYFTHLRNNAKLLTGVAAWSKVDLTISRKSGGVTAYGNIVSDNYFSVLGAKPALGRFFLPGEDAAPGANALVVVSHDFWKTHLGGDSAIVGGIVGVNGKPYTLIGVAAPEFHGVFTPIVTSAWVPLSMQPHVKPMRSLDGMTNWLWVFARKADNAPDAATRSELHSLLASYISTAVEPDWSHNYDGIRTITLTGLPDDARKVMAAFLSVLMAASLLVLIIAGVNVAAMLSARAIARRHEMALRAALGAQRARLVRQLVTETMVLFVGGAALGLTFAWMATTALDQISLPNNVPFQITLPIDARVIVFAVLLSLGAGVVFGLLPALRAARRDLQTQLRSEGTGSGRRRPVVNNVLVVGQLALSLVLLVSAGLLVRALQRGSNTHPGFDAAHVSVAALTSEAWGYNETKAKQFFAELRERLESVPGISNVTYASLVPVTMESNSVQVTTDPTAVGDGDKQAGILAGINAVDEEYFQLLRIQMVAGRAIDATDTRESTPVVVINETLAKKGWPNGSAVGRTLRMYDKQFTIVGVARDAKYATLTENLAGYVYQPLSQQWRSDISLFVRADHVADEVVAKTITSVVRQMDPALPVPMVRSLNAAMSFSLVPQRVAAMIAGSLGLVGLLLATVGLYGIVAYTVGQRRREIGIRMALGAARSDVQRTVLRDGMRLAATGVVIGLGISLAASRLLTTYLYGVSPADAVTYALVGSLFVAVTLFANFLPARRASLADPVVVLRGE